MRNFKILEIQTVFDYFLFVFMDVLSQNTSNVAFHEGKSRHLFQELAIFPLKSGQDVKNFDKKLTHDAELFCKFVRTNDFKYVGTLTS